MREKISLSDIRQFLDGASGRQINDLMQKYPELYDMLYGKTITIFNQYKQKDERYRLPPSTQVACFKHLLEHNQVNREIPLNIWDNNPLIRSLLTEKSIVINLNTTQTNVVKILLPELLNIFKLAARRILPKIALFIWENNSRLMNYINDEENTISCFKVILRCKSQKLISLFCYNNQLLFDRINELPTNKLLSILALIMRSNKENKTNPFIRGCLECIHDPNIIRELLSERYVMEFKFHDWQLNALTARLTELNNNSSSKKTAFCPEKIRFFYHNRFLDADESSNKLATAQSVENNEQKPKQEQVMVHPKMMDPFLTHVPILTNASCSKPDDIQQGKTSNSPQYQNRLKHPEINNKRESSPDESDSRKRKTTPGDVDKHTGDFLRFFGYHNLLEDSPDAYINYCSRVDMCDLSIVKGPSDIDDLLNELTKIQENLDNKSTSI